MNAATIKKLRKSLGITQAELAQVLGCTIYSVEHWEQGVRKPSEEWEERIQVLQKKAKKLLDKKTGK